MSTEKSVMNSKLDVSNVKSYFLFKRQMFIEAEMRKEKRPRIFVKYSFHGKSR